MNHFPLKVRCVDFFQNRYGISPSKHFVPEIRNSEGATDTHESIIKVKSPHSVLDFRVQGSQIVYHGLSHRCQGSSLDVGLSRCASLYAMGPTLHGCSKGWM